jgi:hypothetical protein
MRIVCVWDGSGHAMAALESVVPLFQPQAVALVEILMVIWPQRDTAMWQDIAERAVVADDLHRAAAEVATADAMRLRAVLSPLAAEVTVATADGETIPAVAKAIRNLDADLLLLIIGPHDPSGTIADHLRSIVRDATVPVWILHAPPESG